jgi:hypothetical protein
VDFNWARSFDRTLHREEPAEPSKKHIVVAWAAGIVAVLFMGTVAARMAAPTIHPDEWGFLTNGQALIGHVEAPIPTGSFYPAGFGIITGLAALVSGSISGAYRITLFVNIGFALATAWWAGRLARQVFQVSQNVSRVVMALVAVLPGTLVSAMFAWPEIAARLAFLGFISLVYRAVLKTSPRVVLVLTACTGLMPALHGRFTLLLPVIALLCVYLWRAARLSFAWLVAAGAAMVSGYAVSYVLNKFVKASIYTESYDQENRLLSRLFRPDLWPALLRTMVGQTWYLLATSLGIVGLGMVFAVHSAVKNRSSRTRDESTWAESVTLAVLAFSVFSIIFTGGLQLLHGNRGDHLMYGRYVEMMVPAVVVVAVVALSRRGAFASRAWLGALVVMPMLSIAYVIVDGGDGVKGGASRRNIVFPNIVGADAARYVVSPGFLTFTAFFLTVGLAVWLIARKSRAAGIVALVLLFAVGDITSGQRSLLSRSDNMEGVTQTIDLVKGSGTTLVGFDAGVRNDPSYYYLRYRLHPVRIVRFDFSTPGTRVPAEYSCLYGWGDKPPADGEWSIVADEVGVARVLWQRVGSPHC